MYWDGADWWAWIPMSLVMLAFWGLIAWSVYQLVRGWRPDGRQQQSPREILDERLARGEIDSTEYRERLAALDGERDDLPASPATRSESYPSI
jgi:putative membrane protein